MSFRKSSLSRNDGFTPLVGGSSDMNDSGEPLSNVRSRASATGSRKPVAGHTVVETNSSPGGNSNEKSGHHHHHHHHRHIGRRRRMGDGSGPNRQNTGRSDDTIRLNAMGRIYARIVGFSVVTRYLVYIVPVGLLLAVPLIVLAATGRRNDIPVGSNEVKEKGKEPRLVVGPPLFNLFLWIEITWLSLWAAKVVAWMLPRLFMFFCGIVSVGVRKYATVLSNLSISLSLFFSALASWLTFKNVFSRSQDADITWAVTLERILGALFVATAVLLGEKAIVQLIGVSYHQRSFANRIKASKREVYLLGLLYEASRTLFPMYGQDFADEDYVINDSIELMLKGRKGNKTTGSATPMRLIGDVGRFGDKVTSVFGNIASEITGKQVFNPNSAHSIVLEALEKKRPTEALARRIWLSFVVEGKDALFLEDFYEVLGSKYTAEAEEVFETIDSDMNGDISLEEMIRKVSEISHERKAIGEGMKDIGQALQVFDKVLLVVVLIIVIFVFLAFFRSSFIAVVATAGTALLSLSFIFAVTTQEFLGSCIFLFVKHPYDVGDRVEITNTQMVVDKISLLYTVFTRADKMQVVQIPNIQLNNLWVENISRSRAMLECISIDVSYDTSFEDIELLRLEMERFVRAPDNSRDFQPDFTISVGGVGNLDKLTLNICINHKSNWHNDSVRATRRSKFMCALAIALKKVPISGPGGGGDALGGPANPAYSVSVSDAFAIKSREESAQAKDAQRMKPTADNKTSEEALDSEMQAISELNTRTATVERTGPWDVARDDRTVGSRDDDAAADDDDTRRSKDIESIRTDLLKRESVRGRRRAGEGIESMSSLDSSGPSAGMPSSGGTGGFPHHGTSAAAASPRLETFDEEAQTGMGPGLSASGHRPPRISDDEIALQPMRSATSQRGGSLGRRSHSRGPPPRDGH